MRRLRAVIATALLVLGVVSPAAAADNADPSMWAWRHATQRVVDWAQSFRTLLAGSESAEPPPAPAPTDATESAEPDGSGDAASTTDPPCETEAFPGYDPDG